MNTTFISILISLLSSAIGISESLFEPLFKKYGLLKKESEHQQRISEKIDMLTASLKKSSELMLEIEDEFNKQKELAEKWKQQANTSQIIASMNKDEVEAARNIFETLNEKTNKRNERNSWVQSIIFLILGFILGIVSGIVSGVAGNIIYAKYFK